MYRRDLWCLIDAGPIESIGRFMTDRGETLEVGLCHFDGAFSGFRWNEDRGYEPIFVEECNWSTRTMMLSVCSFTEGNSYSEDELAAELKRFHARRSTSSYHEPRPTVEYSNNESTSLLNEDSVAPDDTAVRTALWRALHLEVDPPPHVFEDGFGLKLVAPDKGWRNRPDMMPFTKPFRASIVARARFVEDLVQEQAARGVGQYVILGAGLDTFAQRRPELASRMVVYEIEQPGPQEWKRRRLIDLGFAIPSYLKFVPVDFEAGDMWWERLVESGFDLRRPAVVASTGVSMYLTREAIVATLSKVARLVPGSTLAMSFMLPIEMVEPEVRVGVERAAEGARANGTPFISFFRPDEMLALARDAGFREVQHVSAAMLAERYFAERTDGLRPPINSEELLVATT